VLKALAFLFVFTIGGLPLGAGSQPATPAADAPAASGSEQYTPVIPSVPSPPQWFPGSDGQIHLVYELFLTNAFPVAVDVMSVEIFDAITADSVAVIEGDALVAVMSLLTSPTEPTAYLPPSSIGVVWVDLPLSSRADLPEAVAHDLTVRVPPGLPVPEEITLSGAAVEVDLREPVTLGAPLSGAQWTALGSCCDGPHRRSLQPVDGDLHLAQRFAIDFNLLDAENRLGFGDPTLNESTPGYGQPVIAVADATVVAAVDGLPDQTPGSPPTGITLETAEGNHVILDLGNGRYAFYAHLRPGTVAVETGDTVRKGDPIGELGNSGSSDGAHLHFHVMDSPSALSGNGMPYVFEEFDLTGQLPPLPEIFPLYEAQQSIPFDKTDFGPRDDSFPLGGNVMTFPN
jgi:hypothetical protein